jgi:hypothetical protein
MAAPGDRGIPVRFTEIGLQLPAKLHVSVGFGYSSRAESKYILGQCWARRASADGVNHIFLGPQEGDPAAMLVSRHCCVGRSRMAGDWWGDCTPYDLCLRRLPVPA